jgi:hypothetical protein
LADIGQQLTSLALMLDHCGGGEHMRDHVRHTLKSQGAHFIVLFGRFAVEVLES